jgi:hypothetical protein
MGESSMTTTVEASPSEGSGLGRKPLRGAAWFVGLPLAFAGLAATAVIGSGAQPTLLAFALALPPTLIATALAWREGNGAVGRSSSS